MSPAIHSTVWFREDSNTRTDSREKKQRKTKIKMGEIHYIYVWYTGNNKQSGGGQASISQTHLGSDVRKRICSENKKKLIFVYDFTSYFFRSICVML